MRSFWAWLGWLAAVWAAFLLHAGAEGVQWGALGCALFFAFYFVSPLFRHRPAVYFAVLSGALLAAAATWSILGQVVGGAGTLYALLMTSYLAGEAVFRLPLRWAAAFGAVASVALLALTYWASHDGRRMLPFVALYVIALAAAMAVYRRERAENLEGGARYEALLDEYRKLKRHVKDSEEAARMEERTNIARQIHDSVGHKLTSLLMQLELFRMNTEGDVRSRAEQMKRLAQESLEETRKAVRALKEQEQGGIPALVRLIRNLEAESYLRVEFSIRHGALSVPLGNEQSIAVYRAIQEALTNAMRHGVSRNVAIRLESPGGRIFRFEVVNDTGSREAQPVREGFGLTAMRERVEKAGGQLEVMHAGGRFLVRGTFKLERAGESER